MIIALAALVFQTQEPGPIVLPPGSSPEFQAMVYAVQAAVDTGDWAAAKRLADRLPTLEVSIQWDEQGLTENQKLFFRQTRDVAVTVWKTSFPTLDVKFVPKGRIKIGFVPTLPPNNETIGPAAAVYLTSPDAGDPVVEGVWALFRTEQKRPIDKFEIRNETLYAIGAYLGLARQVRTGNLMFRSEEPYLVENNITLGDSRLAQKNVAIADRVRKDVAAKKDPGIASPQISINPAKFEPKPVGQAEQMLLSLQITNQGKGVLDYRLVPDCGCFIIGIYKEKLGPGETTVVPILINTREFTGKLTKALFLYSNDPYFPIKRIPLETTVRPAYRFVDQMKETSLIVDENGAKFETILVLDESKSFKITKSSVSGVSARVSVDDKMWEGVLDWPEMGEGPKMRKGYRISALVATGIPPGRLSMQFEFETDDPDYFKRIHHSVFVQKGIVAVPLSIYFGSIPQQPARASVVLTRPGRPYKILKVESDIEFIKASVEPYHPNTEYKIVAVFTGKAPLGHFVSRIKVHTDDPTQPIVEIGVEGTVK